MMRALPMATKLPASERIHVYLPTAALDDLKWLEQRLRVPKKGSTGRVLAAAARCFRATLEAGLAAESGELMGVAAAAAPKPNGRARR